jgi:fibronectin-binding autotransporter adhesin
MATDILWSGATTGTLNWNTNDNWTGGVFVNSDSDRADLRKDWASATINLSAPVTANGILSDDTGASSDTSLTIGNGGNTANTLTLGGTNPSISAEGGSTLSISANLLSAGFTKSGNGFLILSGNNSISGDLVVSDGMVVTGSTTAFNSGTMLRVDSGATLRVNNVVTIAGLTDNAGSGGSIANASGGGKTLTIGGSGSYSFNGNFTTGGAGKVGLLISGTATQILGGTNTTNTGYQSVTGSGGTLVFAKQNSIFQGLSTGAVVNANNAVNAGISVSSGGTVALGVGNSASGYFDATAISTFLDASHMGASTNSTGFRNNSILGFDTTNATGGTFTYSTALANIGSSTGIGFAKLGAGTLVLDAANTYGGVTQVRAGTLQLGGGATSGSISSSADITVSSGATLAFNRSDTLTLAGKITGGGGIFQTGSGETILNSAASDFSGPVAVSGGTLRVKTMGAGNVTISATTKQLILNSSSNYGNAITINGATGVSSGGVIDTGSGIHATLSGPITISASPTSGGHFASALDGSLTVNGTITSTVPVVFRRGTGIFSGGGTGYDTFRGRAGTVKLGANNGLATTATVALGGDGAATLDLAGYNQSLVGITKGNNPATITNSGGIDSELTLTGTSSYDGVIVDGTTNKVALNVNGGTLTFGGTNTYTGSTSITGGTLVVNGDQSSATGNVSVNAGATLKGNGTIGGATTVNGTTGNSAIHSPGTSVGKQTIANDLNYGQFSIFEWELASNTIADRGTTGFDAVDVTGAGSDLAIDAAAAFKVVLNGAGSSVTFSDNTFWDSQKSWQVFSVGGATTGGFANFIVTPDSIGNSYTSYYPSGAFTYTGNTLSWSPVPEVSNLLAAGLLGAGLLRRRRNSGMAWRASGRGRCGCLELIRRT